MSMSKRDYEAIAGVIRDENQRINSDFDPLPDTIERIANRLSEIMAAANPRFDRSRFLAACRGEDSKDSAGRTVRYSDIPAVSAKGQFSRRGGDL